MFAFSATIKTTAKKSNKATVPKSHFTAVYEANYATITTTISLSVNSTATTTNVYAFSTTIKATAK